MAQGIQYQSPVYREAYLPEQLIPLMDQVGGYHQQRADMASGQIANMYKDLYDRQIYDPNAFQQEVGNIQNKVEDINKQYNGDLSAGMNDYIKLIGKAKQSPFWKTNDLLNKEQEKQQAITDNLKAQGKNVLPFSPLPTKATTIDPTTGQQRYLRPDEIKFDVQGQLDWDKKQEDIWKESLHETSTKAGLPKEMIGTTPFIEIAKARGITDGQVLKKAAYALEGYKNTDEYAQQKRALMAGISPGHIGNKLSDSEAEGIIADDVLNAGKRKEYWSDDSQIIHDNKYGEKNKTSKPWDVDQQNTQAATTNMPTPPVQDVKIPMNQSNYEKSLNYTNPDTWDYLMNKMSSKLGWNTQKEDEQLKQQESNLLGKKVSKYSSPYMYAASDEGKKDMPGLLDVLGGVTGNNKDLQRKQKEDNNTWHNRINQVYNNEINRVGTVSYTEPHLEPKQQVISSEYLLGKGASSKNLDKTIPSSDLDNYTYEVVDKNGTRTKYNASEFFDDYINKGWGDKKSRPDFVANSNVDGYTYADQGNKWRVKYTGKPNDKIYINSTDDNQRSKYLQPYKDLFASQLQPGQHIVERDIPFPSADGTPMQRHVVSGNVYDSKNKSYKFGMFVVDPNTGDFIRNTNGTPYDAKDQILKLSAMADPWTYTDRYGWNKSESKETINEP